MEFRPCIDLHQGVVKQIVGSTLKDEDNSAKVNFSSSESSAYYATLYKKHNLRGGHIIKLGPGNEEAARLALKAYPQGMHIGGGITADNAKEWIDAGASHVIVTSYVFSDGVIQWDNLKKLVAAVGKEHIVLDLSCIQKGANYYVVTDRWQKMTNFTLNGDNFDILAQYCDEFLVHAASVEGLQQGPDLTLVKLLAAISPIPCTYAGGVATMKHLKQIESVSQGRIPVTIGSALDLFGGPLSFDEVVAFCNQKKV